MTRALAICHPGGGTGGVFHAGARDAGAAVEEWTPAETPWPPRPLGDYDALIGLGGDQNVHEQDRFPYLADELAILLSGLTDATIFAWARAGCPAGLRAKADPLFDFFLHGAKAP